MRCFKKVLSIILSLVFCFTAIYTTATIPAYAATPSNQIINGDFSNGLTGYDISANKTHDEAMTVENGVCHIPTVTSTVANDKPFNRWLNQKVILENGKYLFSYDLDITYTTENAYSFAHAVRNAENMDANMIRPHSGSANTGFTVDNPTVEALDYVLNTNDATSAAPLTNFALSTKSNYYNYNGATGRQVGRVSFLVTVNNTSAETTALYFSIGNYANACSAYIDNVSVERLSVVNGDFSNGLSGYDISAKQNVSNAEISVENGVCYIPVLTASSAYNRWVNQKVVLGNGKYVFSFDLDVTFASKNAYAFAYAVRTETDMELGYMRPRNMSNATLTGEFTVSNPVISALDYVLNTADVTDSTLLNSFSLSNTSKYYNYSGTAGRQIGRVSFIVDVNNTASRTTELYFSIGSYASACNAAYIDNITLEEFDSSDIIQNGDFEQGEAEYLNADDVNSHITVYDNDNAARPGYGAVTLDGKAAYISGGADISDQTQRKYYVLQYRMLCLPAGQYTIRMNVLFNMIDTSSWAPLSFGITDAINANGLAYGNRIINSTGSGATLSFTDYSVKVTENSNEVACAASYLYHRIAGATLSAGWHDLDVEISFKTTQSKTLYFFLRCGGDATEEGMQGTAYVDNVSIYESAKIDYSYLNVADSSIDTATTEYKKVNSPVAVTVPQIAGYNVMGYKIGTDDIVFGSICEFLIVDDENISFLYALKGDLNDDLSIDDLDFSFLQKCILEIDADYNIFGAKVNDDNLIDIVDLVALEIKIEDL